jgi:Ca2+:H+ antiporter
LTEKKSEESTKENSSLILNIIFLIISLIITVLLAKTISPTIENYIIEANLPHSLLGIIIALVILLPEGIAATKAAYKDDIQSSLNLSLGSALAAIGLTIPSVAVVSTIFKIDIVLGLNNISMVLLGLTIFTVMLSLSKGRTNILYGVILIILFVTYVFTIIYP